ncbi:MAG: glycoside hydrolase family 15 protein [Hymenobacteraceae bacterium]|nr:glycoside hydrolase family 15 protein [Hymenobacteraceae bacterium]MDX5395830.1 glycoside hydrolase family 15 protein [Hymenobacteraceae bacterium]MDX5442996.1 glycoside hydrolase family 15 protein [Hymenobacteraceae bacterium]MDX5511885.1 glycoside hydrolase family 15 protein [Hymenobacteraceae bacterium]
MATKLSDYALIGNARAAALVSNTGSVDWCCLPEFDSPSIFAALLDPEIGGCFSIRPTAQFSSSQNYLPDTNVVETAFETNTGKARLVDAFTAMTEAEKLQALYPDHEILRVVEGMSGAVEFKMTYAPRIFYGKSQASLNNHQKMGICFIWKENVYNLLSTREPDQILLDKEKSEATAVFKVQAGERVVFSLSYSSQSPAIVPEIKTTGWARMQQTVNYWKNWINGCKYTGLYQDHVRRSALALKLLTHAPSGAIVAAPTTSLPEEPGGERNWDYRYCWLRDASFTIRALIAIGFEEEAHAYFSWILHATQLTRPKLQVVYSVFGHSSLKENKLNWLSGYLNSRPVRIGNGADEQFQLDVYGEVLDAIYAYSSLIKSFSNDTKKFALQLGTAICELWDKPDNGIWEVRSDLAHHTHSKVMAWVGLDRLVKLCSRFNWDAPVEAYERTAAKIKNSIEQAGFSKELNTYTREYNGSSLDASLLVLSLVGYCPASSPRMTATIKCIFEKLSKNKLIYRYRQVNDGLSGGEGTFGVCSFWLAECLAKAGRVAEAKEIFETMLQHATSAGLFSEEIDPDTHALLGNFPQGFTHIGLINAALCINEATKTNKV